MGFDLEEIFKGVILGPRRGSLNILLVWPSYSLLEDL